MAIVEKSNEIAAAQEMIATLGPSARSIANIMLAQDRILQLADTQDHIVPSHDPQL